MTVTPIRRGPRSWELLHEARPLPMNAYRRLHFHQRAAYDAEWRSTFAWLARQARIPHLQAVTITIAQTCRRPPLPDVGAAFPTAKAAIDGLVDARVVPDDTPAYVRALIFVAPERGDADRLLVLIEEAEPQGVPS